MSLTGRVPLLVLLGLVPAVLRPQASTVWVWMLLLVLAVLLDLLLAPRPDQVEVRRLRTENARHGDTTTSEWTVRNTSRRPVDLLVRDAWQPSAGPGHDRHRVRLAPGEVARLATSLTPQRRGYLRALGVTVRSHGPLGLAARQATRDVPGELRALPRFDSRKHLPSRLARLRELDGRAAVRVRGQGTEFDSLRDYVRGDDVRSIDWRASSRSRNVVVRTWQPERDRRVILLVDTSRTSAGRVGDVPRLDSQLEAAQLLTALASRAGDRVDLLAGDRRVRVRLRTSGSSATHDVAQALSVVQPEIVEADWQGLAAAVTALGRHRALLVLLTPLEPHPVTEGLLPKLATLTRHHRVVLASVRDPQLREVAARRDNPADVYAASAAEHVLAQREHTALVLRRLGVDVIDVDPDDLPPALCDHYLTLKARGQL